ncbi:(2,3-dihydroxybenzoyl)adenylate synthase [Nocardiopsis aegyptia]|uniref:2,3-dihydroxybenzoate-AMP ligase n=1 Tax=Nocardiopsis aegyptia TaxID=220378 RepID=A0A7Z0EQ61_9ACTN|nr:(2,3-dihydroxybenzoyl)adenylate synthase [Nocardiopsis aegyptia]NYJ35862.1 2,3-dihydroxybenzoate-AMP ligase [Nocardiopsis aegyptia]
MWSEEFAARYRERGYWTGTTLGEVLRGAAARHPARTALVDGDTRLTYAELDALANRRAAGLRRRGLAAGDNVVVQLANTAEFLVTTFALLRLGARPVYALPAHRRSEISYLVAHSGAAAYVIPDRHAGFDFRVLAGEVADDSVRVLVDGDPGPYTALADVDADPVDLPEPDPSSVALFLLSGGTTGLPKLIPRTHDDYAYNLRASAEVTGMDAETVYLAALPVSHNFALACPGVLGTLYAGGTVVMAPSPSPADAFALIEREGVTVTALVPSLALLWLEAVKAVRRDLSSLRLLQVGGARLAEEPARRIRPELGCALQQVFGMAEGLLNYTRLDDPEDVVATTQGRPLCEDDEIRIVDSEGAEVAPGGIGELLTRGPYTLRGYYRAEEHNARSFTPDGFYVTGDLVRRLPTGHLVVEGRVKDVINRGGEKVPTEEVEDHLMTHPAVREAALVGVPDPMLGERSCAFLRVRDGERAPALRELTAYLRERGLADYKLPDRVEVRAEFPYTAVGKVSKKALVEGLS